MYASMSFIPLPHSFSRLWVKITDQGEGFDPNDVPDCTADENLEKECGRGIKLMEAYMDEVRYMDNGRTVEMILYRTRPNS
jgi:serine/threonine-protein kinase RsbW